MASCARCRARCCKPLVQRKAIPWLTWQWHAAPAVPDAWVCLYLLSLTALPFLYPGAVQRSPNHHLWETSFLLS